MRPSLQAQDHPTGTWTYASLLVLDGPRQLRPSQVGPNRIDFQSPPHLASSQIEIILTNGTEEQRHWATVLPHDAEATQIPIRLSPPHFLKP
jgi:hypothetical protein